MPNKKSDQQKKQQAKRERRSARRKERAKKIAAQERDKEVLEIKRRRRAEFPEFAYLEEHGNPEFVDIVKRAIRRFDFAELGKTEQIAFGMMKQFGAAHALASIKNNMRKLQEEGADNAYVVSADLQWLCSVGGAVFSHIPDEVKRRFLPMNDAEFRHRDDVIVVKFRSLLTQKSSGGTIYYSRHKPTIDFEGKEYIVGFSTEALKRTCERTGEGPAEIRPLWEMCMHTLRIVSILSHAPYETGAPRSRFLTSVFLIPRQSWPHRSGCCQEKILNTKEVDPAKGKLYYRVGYCPVALDKGFAKAKTLLFPGFKKTPEYEALDNAHMPPKTKRRLQRLAKTSDMSSLLETWDVSALKWFDDKGVRQVIQTTKPLFRRTT